MFKQIYRRKKDEICIIHAVFVFKQFWLKIFCYAAASSAVLLSVFRKSALFPLAVTLELPSLDHMTNSVISER
jgi:uncharacterized membrane protein